MTLCQLQWQQKRPQSGLPRKGSTSGLFATGGTIPDTRTSEATTSSKETPMGWPVKPFVLHMSRCCISSRKTLRRPWISFHAHEAVGDAWVDVSWEKYTPLRAISPRVIPCSVSMEEINLSISCCRKRRKRQHDEKKIFSKSRDDPCSRYTQVRQVLGPGCLPLRYA